MVKETKRGSKDMLTCDKIIILIHAKNKIESRWFAKENVNMLEVEKKESEGWSTYTIYHIESTKKNRFCDYFKEHVRFVWIGLLPPIIFHFECIRWILFVQQVNL